MKNFVRVLLLQVSLAVAVGVAAAQAEGSVWTVDTLKTNSGQQADYLQFVEQN